MSEYVKARVAEIQRKMEQLFPEIERQVEVYENKKAKGELTENPKSGPQFGR